MAFLEERISDAVSRGSRGGPRARRTKVYVENGRVTQTHRWSRPLHAYDISYGMTTIELFEEVRALFYVVLFGPYDGFRLKDWNDYKLTQDTSQLVFVSGTDWQIHRKYTVGASTYLRKVQKPVDGTVTVYRTRSGAVTTATAVVDETTGIADISGHAGGDTYTCEGEFDVPVTFADDSMDQIGLDGTVKQVLQQLESVMLEEIVL